MASGGKREGAGRHFGSKNLSTIAKEEAREFVRTYITDRLQPVLDAQIDKSPREHGVRFRNESVNGGWDHHTNIKEDLPEVCCSTG